MQYGHTLRALFQEIDLDLDEKITEADFQVFIEKNGVFKPNQLDLRGLVHKMGGLKYGRGQTFYKVTFNDFCEELQPRN